MAKKRRTLRDKYMADADASKFLEAYPEFDDRFIEPIDAEQCWNTTKGRYSLYEPDRSLQEYGNTMLEAVQLMNAGPAKSLLEAYYNGAPLSALQVQFKVKTQLALRQRIDRAKKSALKRMLGRQRVRILNQTPLETKVFSYNERVRFIYLVYDEVSESLIWVDEKGEAYPEYVQQILDEAEDFNEWDKVFL